MEPEALGAALGRRDRLSRFLVDTILRPTRDWRDWLFVGLGIQWVFVNIVLYPQYSWMLYQAGTFQTVTPGIFGVTWGSAVALVLYGLFLFRRRYRADLVRTVLYSFGIGLAATSFFEIIWQNIGAGVGIGNQALWGQVINVSSIALVLAPLRFWRISRAFLSCLALYFAVWILWMSFGFPQTYYANPTQSSVAFVFNASLKMASFALLGLLVSLAPRGSAIDDRVPIVDSGSSTGTGKPSG